MSTLISQRNAADTKRLSVISYIYFKYYRDHHVWIDVPFGELYGYPMLIDNNNFEQIKGTADIFNFIKQITPNYDIEMLHHYGYSVWPILLRDCWRVKPSIPNKNHSHQT